MYKRNCFAFRPNAGAKLPECEALTVLRCEGCRFYKEADTVEYFEMDYQGRKTWGYTDKKGAKLLRLMKAKREIESQIQALNHEH